MARRYLAVDFGQRLEETLRCEIAVGYETFQVVHELFVQLGCFRHDASFIAKGGGEEGGSGGKALMSDHD
ncbi:hypothetical protein Tdes44962_MAKER07073 [Teratosphaeria destructans]|uniref:Uncharacterized protein n=1 Tax=Teratosphaeria destructans TaxID=418781 RepID=A0A9W7W6C8_9PEZI|nr:hypothetical protein Tdes44962_MAKER07073 [Teratosphaeria destructans]